MMRPAKMLLLCCFLWMNSQMLFAQTRTNYLLDKGWKFTKGDVAEATQPSFNDGAWQTVTVPHDWAITGPFDGQNDLQKTAIAQNGETKATVKSGRTGGLPFIGVGWYRNAFTAPVFKKGMRAELVFDGAMSYPKVYVNGKFAGEWAYGYNSFHLDITSLLQPGQTNLLAVRCENLTEQSRWYPGAGLYRNVHLVVTQDAAVPVWGTYLTTPEVNTAFAKVKLRTSVQTLSGSFKPYRLQTDIVAGNGQTVASTSTELLATDGFEFEQNLVVSKPELWSPETPVLYKAVSKLYDGNVLKDEYTTSFGIRSFKFEAEKGFSLNGIYRKFKGVCNHHDLGPLGSAVNTAALRRQLMLLKDMGCDAIRTSHNMPAPELVQLCDEMGFMMMVESFDEWKAPKVKNGYSHLFDAWAEKDMVNMIHRDRNHPSVIMWSIGNEVPDQSSKEGNKILKYLQDICHREDPTRPVTAGMDRIQQALDNNFAALLDIAGFNYKPAQYEAANKRLPQGFVLGSETASTISSRGVYKFPVWRYKNKKYDDNQCSSYDLEACSWSQIPDDEFIKQDDLPFMLGEFVWTGFDYLGEPTPYDEVWPSHSSYFGIIDLAGLPKDRYYLYRSRWNTQKPTLHLLPHWTFPGREGQVTPVFCYTSYPSAELFVNGKSMGKRSKSNDSATARYRLMWNDVVYQPGNIKVVAYDASGHVAGEETVNTAGKPHHLELVAGAQQLAADGKDLSYITVKVVDAAGNLCPDADTDIQFATTGAGSFKVVANGDAASLELFHVPHMKAFKGMLVATVQAGEAPGNLVLKATAKGLKGAQLNVVVK